MSAMGSRGAAVMEKMSWKKIIVKTQFTNKIIDCLDGKTRNPIALQYLGEGLVVDTSTIFYEKF